MENYADYHDLERYVFNKVGPAFRSTGSMSTTDFFCIVIWKANRSKSIIANKMLQNGKYARFDFAVGELCLQLSSSHNPKDKLRVLVDA